VRENPASREHRSAAQPASVPLGLLLLLVTAGLLACGGLWTYILITRPAALARATVTPIFVVITPGAAPAAAQTLATPTIAMPVQATATFPPPPAGSLIKVGALVKVVDTGEGLRLRVDAGVEGKVNYLAMDYEVFEVREGPREASGFTWWYLVSQSDTARNGWGVSNYLQVTR
jgi:hypothetical protein